MKTGAIWKGRKIKKKKKKKEKKNKEKERKRKDIYIYTEKDRIKKQGYLSRVEDAVSVSIGCKEDLLVERLLLRRENAEL